jgi:hypothetical protein
MWIAPCKRSAARGGRGLIIENKKKRLPPFSPFKKEMADQKPAIPNN